MNKSDPVACIILAAGDSKRMGRPKALLLYKGTTFIEKLITDYRRIGCRLIVVVLGKDADRIRPHLEETGVSVKVNPRPEGGLLSSLQIGLRALPSNCAGFFSAPVDHPAVKADTLLNMLEEWDGSSSKALRLRFDGRGGHPVLLGRDWIGDLLALPLASNLRELLHRRSSDVIEFPVADPGILLNVDTPEEYQRLLEEQSEAEN